MDTPAAFKVCYDCYHKIEVTYDHRIAELKLFINGSLKKSLRFDPAKMKAEDWPEDKLVDVMFNDNKHNSAPVSISHFEYGPLDLE